MRGVWLRRLISVSLTAVVIVCQPALAADGLVERRAPGFKKTFAQMRAEPAVNQVTVKFREGRQVRLRAGVLTGVSGSEAASFTRVLRELGLPPGTVRRLHRRPEVELDLERVAAEQVSGRELADLNLYYVINLPAGVSAALVADRLNTLPIVEFAEPALRPAPPPSDISPPTPSYLNLQGYKAAPPKGIGVLGPATYPGADGRGMAFADVEYSWEINHEDIELPVSRILDQGAYPDDPFGDTNHGTAVLGEVVGRRNAYGVTGIAPAAVAYLAPANTSYYGYHPARAISIATGVLRRGDAILIEQQTPVCGGRCDASQVGCGPLEYDQGSFDAIATATARGIIVVEAAGNGNVNLDSPSCNGRFNRSVRNSRAIIVGAGTSTNHARLGFSSYGSRVDVQGWGENVTTTGYGDLFNPNGDVRQRYTKTFGGTSSASPIVTGAVLAVQGVRKACGLAPLSPAQMRTALVSTGTPQANAGTGRIGPLPRVEAALRASGANACMNARTKGAAAPAPQLSQLAP